MDPKVVADEFADYKIEDFDWIIRLEEFILDARGKNKIPVIVALARKMQRFLKWCHTSDKCLRKERINKLHIYDESQTVLITEHSIPIVIPSCKPETHSIVILDDLIIYGNSIEIVAENIYYCTGIKPSYIAIGKTERALSIPFATDFGIGTPVICDKDLSLFTTRNSLAILSLQHPIDLEYCILSFLLKKSESDLIKKHLLERILRIFKAPDFAVYETKHRVYGIDCTNVTICKLSGNNPLYYNNSDFNKLRIFVSQDELKIVSYAPNILFENEIHEDTRLFLGTDFENLWRIVYKAIENSDISTTKLEHNSFWANIIEKEYGHRKQLTKVIWANYLSSYNNILSLRNHINQLLESLGVVPMPDTLQDLKLLVGNQLGEIINKQLISLYNTNSIGLLHNHFANVDIATSSLIPESYKEAYYYKNSIKAYYSNNIREALSHIFTNMHYNIGITGNINKDSQLPDRYRFGECYNSLYAFLSNYFLAPQYENGTDLIIEIHKWIDEKVDLGIVIPKYEQSSDPQGRSYWKRYFRAGENEDTFIKLARECLYELDNNKEVFTKQWFLSEVLPIVINRIRYIKQERLFSLMDFMQYDVDTEITPDRVSQRIWSYLLNVPIFEIIKQDGDIQEYKISESVIAQELRKGHIIK